MDWTIHSMLRGLDPDTKKLELHKEFTKLHPVFHVSILKRYHDPGGTPSRQVTTPLEPEKDKNGEMPGSFNEEPKADHGKVTGTKICMAAYLEICGDHDRGTYPRKGEENGFGRDPASLDDAPKAAGQHTSLGEKGDAGHRPADHGKVTGTKICVAAYLETCGDHGRSTYPRKGEEKGFGQDFRHCWMMAEGCKVACLTG
ncbi:hypothetical protein PhCBS80983_g06345 [Powellomyces hirtus]|uniref:Uncharacterized protein n=1 Tax=Powellomyces hirtus TaxID=109895 RepID=A0A507DPS6_9FUNG|nr:hypothetical protein PhCBS80983_g06345 [Powellomyces hirtus]